MYLNNFEEHMLGGSEGLGKSIAMKLLVSLGEMFDADSLIPITRAHWALSGQEGDLYFAEMLANGGASTSVPVTTNPAWDPDLRQEFGVSISEYELSLLNRTIGISNRLGVIKSFNCTPYIHNEVPSLGEHTAFSESSATPYINSVYGARTNRESSASALAAGIIGKTPNYGLHLDENRVPNVLVSLDLPDLDDYEIGILGWYLGDLLEPDNIPLITGMKGLPNPESLRDFGSLLNTSGAVSMYHLAGLTPEAKDPKKVDRWSKGLEKITVTSNDLNSIKEEFSSKSGEINSVYMGCPHSTVNEIIKVNTLLGDRKVKDGVSFLIFTSSTNISILKQGNILDKLGEKGIHVIKDSCVDEPVFKFTEGKLGATNSAKCAYYRQRRNQEFAILGIEDIVEASVRGYL